MPGHHITDQQVHLYMKFRPTHTQAAAAAKAGFSERTGRTLDNDPRPTSQRKRQRTWRTRADPLVSVWTRAEQVLTATPGLMAVTLHEMLQDEFGETAVPDGVRRTLERRVSRWRALHGPDKEVFFPQVHEPGRQALSDFTDAGELAITIAGEPLSHRLFHFRLAYSGWEHGAIVLGGESFTALAQGLQDALWRLGGAPHDHRTDSLSAAFRNLDADARHDATRRYAALCAHYAMTASRNNRGEAHENGAIESANRHLKRRLDQALRRRVSRDFPTLEEYRRFLAKVIDRHNARQAQRLAEERPHLRPLPPSRTADFTELTVPVTRNSTVSIDKVLYTVPARLIGQRLRAHLYDDRIELYLGTTQVDTRERLRTRGNARVHAVNYRHVIGNLRRKPQALRGLAYRDALFPRPAYARTWTALDRTLPPKAACKAMVALLDLAAYGGCETALAARLDSILDTGDIPDIAALTAEFRPALQTIVDVTILPPDITAYDRLMPSAIQECHP
jgi:hypothetical protein